MVFITVLTMRNVSTKLVITIVLAYPATLAMVRNVQTLMSAMKTLTNVPTMLTVTILQVLIPVHVTTDGLAIISNVLTVTNVPKVPSKFTTLQLIHCTIQLNDRSMLNALILMALTIVLATGVTLNLKTLMTMVVKHASTPTNVVTLKAEPKYQATLNGVTTTVTSMPSVQTLTVTTLVHVLKVSLALDSMVNAKISMNVLSWKSVMLMMIAAPKLPPTAMNWTRPPFQHQLTASHFLLCHAT